MEAIFLGAAFFKVTNNINKCDGADINLKPNYTTKTRSCGVHYYYLYEVTLSVHQKAIAAQCMNGRGLWIRV
jgi:hypothetical protein